MKRFNLSLYPYEWDFIQNKIRWIEKDRFFLDLWKKWSVFLFSSEEKIFWEYYRYRIVVNKNLITRNIEIIDILYFLYEYTGKNFGVKGEDILVYFIKREMIENSGSNVLSVA
ncbi:MAG: hypothetical protein ACK4UJ_04110 [Leptonema sp. (in: bacteria)]